MTKRVYRYAILQAANSTYNPTAQEQVIYLHTDHLGTPRMATDSNRRIVWKWESDAFGATPAQQDPDADNKQTVVNLRFPGQYYDVESGLHQNWHRTYDPSLGRYISSDPIGLAGGVNTFGYVGQSPLVLADPNGLCPFCVGALAFIGEAGTTTTAVMGTATIGAAAYGIASTQNALSETSQSSVWGDGAADHPSHADENDALAIPLSASCEELAWAINVLQAAIAWRKEDIRRYGGNNSRAPGHRQRINILQNKLDKLSREFDLRCGKQCSKD